MPGMAARRPALRLGETTAEGIAATVYALLERGVARRPELAREMDGRVDLHFAEDIAPVRIAFAGTQITVEDGAWDDADFRVSGRLPHIVHLTTTPKVAGMPNPTRAQGRAALARLSRGEVRLTGDRALGRKLLRLLEL
jgi:ubiquinone biosynthesis protein UbiJ